MANKYAKVKVTLNENIDEYAVTVEGSAGSEWLDFDNGESFDAHEFVRINRRSWIKVRDILNELIVACGVEEEES
jgi:hypothetical protein